MSGQSAQEGFESWWKWPKWRDARNNWLGITLDGRIEESSNENQWA